MKHNVYTLGAFAVAASLAGAALYFNGSKSVTGNPSTAATTPSVIERSEPVDRSGDDVRSTIIKPNGTPTALEQAMQLLGSNQSDRWHDVEKRFFNRLSPTELWKLLTTPGIESQDEAKFFRQSIIANCGATLDALQRQSSLPNDKALVNDFCKTLASVGDATYFLQQGSLLDADEEFLKKNSFTVSPRDITPEQKSEIDGSLKTLLQSTEDPWQAASLVRGLWSIQSDMVTSDWSDLNAMTPSQRALLRTAVADSVACAMLGGCGPQNPWTVQYCSEVTITCNSGMTLLQAVANNVPPSQMPVYQQIVNRFLDQIPGGYHWP